MKKFLALLLCLVTAATCSLGASAAPAHGFPYNTPAAVAGSQASSNTGNKYQGTRVLISSPGKRNTPEADLTTAQMISLYGSGTAAGVDNSSAAGLEEQLRSYWLPNSMKALNNTFQSFQGVKRDINIGFAASLSDTYGTNSWARCYYYGYGNDGRNNRMVSVSIILDTDDCLDPMAQSQISGTKDLYYADQIIAHELMHAMMAETAPGYLLGGTQREWFTEGAAELVNGGIPHMGNRTAAQLCGNIGASSGVDYGGAYLATAYLSWLSANHGYGERCAVTADNLAYGLDRILAGLRETGDLNQALRNSIGINTVTFEQLVRTGNDGKLQVFLDELVAASTNSEGILGCGSVLGGNLKLQADYVVANHKSSLGARDPVTFSFSPAAAW